MPMSSYDTIVAYHDATKHHFHRYARSAGRMDWANQPNPFRYYEGAAKIPLPLNNTDDETLYHELYRPVTGPARPLDIESLSAFLELSLGLSAWKKAGASRWALRINPSSGNLHPTEAHLVIPEGPNLDGGISHYFSFEHALERRADLPPRLWPQMEAHFGGSGFLVALSTIFWRESWKYGERAYRYCNLDAGHALAALAFSARLNNWTLGCLNGVGDNQIRAMLGFDDTPWHPLEEEAPELLCWVSTAPREINLPRTIPGHLVQLFEQKKFAGTPNVLSRRPLDWSIIRQASDAIGKPITVPEPHSPDACAQVPLSLENTPAAAIIRQRRSAVSYSPQKSMISMDTFQSILSRTLARSDAAPFGVGLMPPAVHLLLFVHRVADLPPGLYFLVRRTEALQALQDQFRKDFLWKRVQPGFPLYRLLEGDATIDATTLSCHQDIAGDSAFAVAMIAEFEALLRPAPYKYRFLHWECGMIGQVLYLEAEACGIRGTGIGCFFDDPVHQLLGVSGKACQSLYHFTVGYPVEDERLATLPAYHHLEDISR